MVDREDREFPGGPVVRTQHFNCRAQVQSLVRELSHSIAKKKKKKGNEIRSLPAVADSLTINYSTMWKI